MKALQARLGQVIQRLRREAGFSQEGFADKVGVHRTYMGAVERGEQNISLRNIERIATALGVRPSALLSQAEETQ